MTSRITSLALVLGAMLHANGNATTQAALPPELAAALQRNAQELSPIDVTFSEQYGSTLPAEELEQRLGMSLESIAGLRKVAVHRVIWQDGLLYMDREQQGRVSEQAWDGRVYYSGGRLKDPEQPGQQILLKDPPARVEEREKDAAPLGMEPDYFYFAGLPLPRGANLVAGRPANSLVLKLLEDGANIRSIVPLQLNDRELTRITLVAENPLRSGAAAVDLERAEERLRESPRLTQEEIRLRVENIRQIRQLPEKWVYEFDLDPELNYALRRCQISYEDGRLLRQWICEELKQVGNRALWLPMRVEHEEYHFWGPQQIYFDTPFMTVTLEARAHKVDRVPPEQFRLDYDAPGTRIIDRTQDPPEETRIPE
jgi:hypothetical protein